MYNVPGPDELRAFMKKNNLTGADVAALTGVKPRAARRWVAPAEHKDYHPIPWAAWALMLVLVEGKTREDVLGMIDDKT